MGATGEDRSGTSKVLAPVGAYAADGQGVVRGASSRQHRAAVWKGVSWVEATAKRLGLNLSERPRWRRP